MALPNPYQNYKTQSLNTMTPGELLITLYDEEIKRIRLGITCIEENLFEQAHTHIIRAQEIISYLNSTLKDGYPISKELEDLYNFIYNQLIQANLKKDISILSDILPLIIDLRDTWKQADRLSRMK